MTDDTAGQAPAVALLRGARRRAIVTVAAAQVVGSLALAAGFAVSSIVTAALASSPAQAGLLQGLSVGGTVLAALALARLTASRGRRWGLAGGYAVAALGAVLAAVAIERASFGAFLVGNMVFAVANATSLQARFAASDLPDPAGRAGGISLVLWMSTVGSVLGPNLATWAGGLARSRGLEPWAGAYVVAAVGFLVAAAVAALWLVPDPLLLARRLPGARAASGAGERRLAPGAAAVARSPDARFALAAMVAAHAVMIGVMTWTPVHMAGGGHPHHAPQAVIGYVLSAHLAGMYALAPVIGWAARRLGDARVVLAGLVVLVAATAGGARLPATAGLGLGVALTALGVGWSAVFVASSSLLTSAVPAGRRVAAQGVADAAVWAGSGASLVLSGWVLGTFGYPWLSYGALALLVPVAVWAASRGPASAPSRDSAR